MKSIIIRAHGGPKVLQVEHGPIPALKPGHALIRNKAIGVNFVDTQHRSGENFPVQLPLVPGIEAAGIVEAIGPDVQYFAPGDRVAYAGYMGGNYAEYTLVPEDKLVPVPGNIGFDTAAAVLVQGMTAHFLSQSAYAIQPGDAILVHAAASGVGALLVQMAKNRGACVIGTVSSAAKIAYASVAGADHVIDAAQQNVSAEVLRLTLGAGVHAVYDAIGRQTFDHGIDALRSRGVMVIYGLASGSVPLFDINRLSGITGSNNKGSLFLTWATLNDYAGTRADRLMRAADVFRWVADGTITQHIAGQLALEDAAAAHFAIEARTSMGKLLLVP